jgi:hypothetical protein
VQAAFRSEMAIVQGHDTTIEGLIVMSRQVRSSSYGDQESSLLNFPVTYRGREGSITNLSLYTFAISEDKLTYSSEGFSSSLEGFRLLLTINELPCTASASVPVGSCLLQWIAVDWMVTLLIAFGSILQHVRLCDTKKTRVANPLTNLLF